MKNQDCYLTPQPISKGEGQEAYLQIIFNMHSVLYVAMKNQLYKG